MLSKKKVFVFCVRALMGFCYVFCRFNNAKNDGYLSEQMFCELCSERRIFMKNILTVFCECNNFQNFAKASKYLKQNKEHMYQYIFIIHALKSNKIGYLFITHHNTKCNTKYLNQNLQQIKLVN